MAAIELYDDFKIDGLMKPYDSLDLVTVVQFH